MNSLVPSPVAPTIANRKQLDVVVENIVSLQMEQIAVLHAQANEIAAVREKYRTTLVELDRYLQIESSWVETWATQNPEAFSPQRTLECAQATIGFRMTPPRVERASRKWTWTAAALRLEESDWGQKYLRIPAPEVNKEAILDDLAHLSAEGLREVGLKIIEGERFYIERHGQSDDDAPAESTWQEAA